MLIVYFVSLLCTFAYSQNVALSPAAFVPGRYNVARSLPVVPPVIPPVIPTVLPPGVAPVVAPGFPIAPRPGVPYNPYYNPAAAAVPILSYSNEHGLGGTYSFSFTTGDGKQAQESGFLKDAYIDNAGEPQGTQVVQGSYAYIAPDGTPIQVSYVADENGFRPSGVHIPTNGKTILPTEIGKKNGQLLDPLFNKYNPYYGQYNRPYEPRLPLNSRYPYDPKYPYEPARYNPYNPYGPIINDLLPTTTEAPKLNA